MVGRWTLLRLALFNLLLTGVDAVWVTSLELPNCLREIAIGITSRISN